MYMCIQFSGDQVLESETKHGADGNYYTFNASEWKQHPPLLRCWLTLLKSISSENLPQLYAVEALSALSLGALRFALDGKRYICTFC